MANNNIGNEKLRPPARWEHVLYAEFHYLPKWDVGGRLKWCLYAAIYPQFGVFHPGQKYQTLQ
jgi:hypothetical protein